MTHHRFVPAEPALRALAAAHPGITQTALAKLIGCSASHLGSELKRHGIELTHGRRSEGTTDRHSLSVRKIPPCRGRTHRSCLTCGTGFMSEGPGNRMCSDCRRTQSE